MKYILPLFFLISSTVSYAQNDEQTLTDLIDEFLSKVDKKEMHDRFWADDLIYTSSSGSRFGKETIIAGFKESNNEDSETEKGPTYTAENTQVKILSAEIAIVAFKLVSINAEGARTEYLNSGTLQKRNGLWKVVNWQATKIPGDK